MQIHSLPCNEYNYMVRMCYLWGTLTHTRMQHNTYFSIHDLSLKINPDGNKWNKRPAASPCLASPYPLATLLLLQIENIYKWKLILRLNQHHRKHLPKSLLMLLSINTLIPSPISRSPSGVSTHNALTQEHEYYDMQHLIRILYYTNV